ncbi:MAG TPA: tetratricopeptide repeat protein [Armatimonadota bacterium]|nr:tetratricopeptide repeat protein [Armatimonadota bacterium]
MELETSDGQAGGEQIRLSDLIREKRWDEALRLLEEALAVRPRDPALWYHRGCALAHLGRLAEAEDALTHCLTERPGSRAAQCLLATISALRRTEGAAEDPPAPISRVRAARPDGRPD